MNKLCKRCGKPVIKNKEDYNIFEQMHWLCFHLEFEHGDYDPDEPCDDPSCPWTRINDYENQLKKYKNIPDLYKYKKGCQ